MVKINEKGILMKKIILVAHGTGGNGTFSIPKVKTITKAGVSLTFDEAIAYINSSKAYPEYSSTSFDTFSPLSDADCTDIFGKIPNGNGIVDTTLRRGKDVAGTPIYTVRGNNDIDQNALTAFIHNNNITSVVLLACRH